MASRCRRVYVCRDRGDVDRADWNRNVSHLPRTPDALRKAVHAGNTGRRSGGRSAAMKPACRRVCDLLAPYADGTLAADERTEVQRHLDACPPCRLIAGKECGARQLLRACADRLRTEQVPPALRARCQELSRRSALAHLWSRRAVRLAIAAVLIIFTGSLLSVVTRQSDALLAAQLTADHVKCFALFGPEQGRTLDAAQAQRMLQDR